MYKKILNAAKYIFLTIVSFISVFPFFWMIVAATNEAIRKVDEESGAAMSKLTGGMGGLGGGLF